MSRKDRCSYCKDPKVFTAPDAAGRLLNFCEDCLLALVTEAIRLGLEKILK